MRSPFTTTGGFKRVLQGHLRRRLVVGALLTIPVVATYLVLRFVFLFLDGLLQPVLARAIGYTVPGAGVIALVVVIYVLGMAVASAAGRYVVRAAQDTILLIPVVNTVYRASKQLVETLGGTDPATGQFKSAAVLVELPPGSACFALAFQTGSTVDMPTGERMAVVYIVTPPSPQSGWLAVVAQRHVYATDLSLGDAMRLTVSGGVLSPHSIRLWRPAAGGTPLPPAEPKAP